MLWSQGGQPRIDMFSGEVTPVPNSPQTDDLVIDALGGMTPVQGDGWIRRLPFYFRARYGYWSFCVSLDPAIDGCDASHIQSPRWMRTRDWECEQADCEHAYCAGGMSRETAQALIEKCARDFAAGEPSDELRETRFDASLRVLTEGLDSGELVSIEYPRAEGEWATRVALWPADQPLPEGARVIDPQSE
jgi:hypothetical protein